MMKIARVLSIVLGTLSFAAPVHAAQCGGDFNTFVAAISREAQQQLSLIHI